MPPVMGAAAFVLAVLTVVPNQEVIIAAIVPALAYLLCRFLPVVFQVRKQGIEAIGRITEEVRLGRQHLLHRVTIIGPILLILFFSLTCREAVGCGLLSGLCGAERVFADGFSRFPAGHGSFR